MAERSSALDDNIFGDSVIVEKPKEAEQPQRRRRERREPYEEPEAAQVDGHEEKVESPNGSIAFVAVRMGNEKFAAAGYPNRAGHELRYRMVEPYAGKPRPFYSYDELEKIRRGEMRR